MNPPKDRESILTRYKEGPSLLERTLADLQDADLDKPPSQGGWTIRQIVHHIVDGDDIWKTCIKMALGNEQAEFFLGWYWALCSSVASLYLSRPNVSAALGWPPLSILCNSWSFSP